MQKGTKFDILDDIRHYEGILKDLRRQLEEKEREDAKSSPNIQMFDDDKFKNEPREPIVDDSQIKGFFKDYFWLSNFYPCTVYLDNSSYPSFSSSENMYQCFKIDEDAYTDNEIRDLVDYFASCSAKEAKIQGNMIKIKSNWTIDRVRAMYDALSAKFDWGHNPVLCKRLINTGTRYLEETNYWRDTFWGYDRNLKRGKNMLGKLLMRVREELKTGMPEEYLQELKTNHYLGVNGFAIPATIDPQYKLDQDED